MITSLHQLDPNKNYTYADYLTWQFKERVELIRGKIFRMSPAPSDEHQRISREILSEGNNKADVDEKFNIYEAAGIPEYWIVHPSEQTVTVYTLQSGKYSGSKPYTAGETIISRAVKGFTLEVSDIFTL